MVAALREEQKSRDVPAVLRLDAVSDLIRALRAGIRKLYYAAVLFAKPCPQCGRPELRMLRDSWCRCDGCGHVFDPTLDRKSAAGLGKSTANDLLAHIGLTWREILQDFKDLGGDQKEKLDELLSAWSEDDKSMTCRPCG